MGIPVSIFLRYSVLNGEQRSYLEVSQPNDRIHTYIPTYLHTYIYIYTVQFRASPDEVRGRLSKLTRRFN